MSSTGRPLHPADRGIGAVVRVREVREHDSRVGLLKALETVRVREAQLEELETALAQATTRDADTLDEYVASRRLLTAMAYAAGEARRRLASSQLVAAEAHSRWQTDKARVRAVEHLLEKRSLRRAEEADRAEAREVDDVVGRLHQRRGAAS